MIYIKFLLSLVALLLDVREPEDDALAPIVRGCIEAARDEAATCRKMDKYTAPALDSSCGPANDALDSPQGETL